MESRYPYYPVPSVGMMAVRARVGLSHLLRHLVCSIFYCSQYAVRESLVARVGRRDVVLSIEWTALVVETDVLTPSRG